jgi:hypothetical protein
VAVLVASSDADAKCMMPSIHFEPASGTLPTSPVLRLFVPKHHAPASPAVTALDAAGKKLSATLALESTSDAYSSYRVTIAAAKAGKLRVSFLDNNGTAHHRDYVVDPKWNKPTIAPIATTVTWTSTSWKCSHQRTRNIVFKSVADAYRVTLTSGKITETVVLPANVSEMFAAYPTGGNATLLLGHVSCMGHTYEWAGGRYARVEALLPDGSSTTIANGIWLDPP